MLSKKKKPSRDGHRKKVQNRYNLSCFEFIFRFSIWGRWRTSHQETRAEIPKNPKPKLKRGMPRRMRTIFWQLFWSGWRGYGEVLPRWPAILHRCKCHNARLAATRFASCKLSQLSSIRVVIIPEDWELSPIFGRSIRCVFHKSLHVLCWQHYPAALGFTVDAACWRCTLHATQLTHSL